MVQYFKEDDEVLDVLHLRKLELQHATKVHYYWIKYCSGKGRMFLMEDSSARENQKVDTVLFEKLRMERNKRNDYSNESEPNSVIPRCVSGSSPKCMTICGIV